MGVFIVAQSIALCRNSTFIQRQQHVYIHHEPETEAAVVLAERNITDSLDMIVYSRKTSVLLDFVASIRFNVAL